MRALGMIVSRSWRASVLRVWVEMVARPWGGST